MAKRFTDTGKWDKAWFRQLSPRHKIIWAFLCDRCDHAGIWEIDMDALSFFVNDVLVVTLDEIKKTFGERIEVFESKLFVTGFVEFQYGELNPENRAHKSVINRLDKLAPYKGLIRPFQGRKDKDKDKDKDKESIKGECEGEIFSPRHNSPIQSAEQLWDYVPLLQQERLRKKYGEPFLSAETANCFNFHVADPGKRPQTTGQWMRKLESWLLSRWDQRPKKAAKLNFAEIAKEEK